ncbi:MAG: YbdD/YjiX family protein [bacterium]
MTASEFVRATGSRLERAACIVRRIIGVPDYDRYLAHVRVAHPNAQPMTREEFTQERLVDRYSKPGSRCC